MWFYETVLFVCAARPRQWQLSSVSVGDFLACTVNEHESDYFVVGGVHRHPGGGHCSVHVALHAHAQESVPEPPFVTYFVLFAHGGIWFLLLLTSYLWGWSGMSSSGALYLMFISPFAIGVFAFGLHDERRDSVFHAIAYWLCLIYACIIIGVFAARMIYCHITPC